MIYFSKHLPSISVVMPVFNGSKFVSEAINSILNQTVQDFEFIVIDDSSTDDTLKIINTFKDKRIHVERNDSNMGNYFCRNKGINKSQGKYICVMDSDDISEPIRFYTQLNIMEKDSDLGICGSNIKIIPQMYIPKYLTDYEHLKVAFLSNNQCSHPSLFLRKAFLDRYYLKYNEKFYYSSDYDLCSRSLQFFKIINIPEILLQYRRHPEQISMAKFYEQSRYADIIRINQLITFLNFKITEIPIPIHLGIMKRQQLHKSLLSSSIRWVTQILDRNKIKRFYNQEFLNQFLYSLLSYSFKMNFSV